MKISELKHLFEFHPAVKGMDEFLRPNGKSIHLNKISGSAVPILLSALFNHLKSHFLIVLPNEEEAEYFRNDLENLEMERQTVMLFDSCKKHFDASEKDSDKLQLRTSSLERINLSNKPLLIVTYPAALAEKTISGEALEDKTYTINVGDSPDLDFMMEILFEQGYEREDFVFQPGHFAIRGSIIDIFSLNSNLPYRIEFDGDSIASIRSFSPETQLSIQNVRWFKLVPNISQIQTEQNTQTFFSYLKLNTIVVTKDLSWILENIEKEVTDESVFINHEQTLRELCNYPVLEFGSYFKLKPNHEINFNQSPQPVFGKGLDLALNHLKENEVLSIKNLIFSDQPRQLERLEAIIKDKQRIIPFEPMYHALSSGFLDKDLKIAVYTEHQIFNRFYRFKNKHGRINKNAALTLKELKDLKIGDFVTHIDHGVGKFAGLQKMDVKGKMQEVVKIIYRDNDMLYVSISSLHKISRFSGQEGTAPKVHKLGSGVWEKQKSNTKRNVKDIARELIKLYAARKSQPGFAFSPDNYLQNELEASFMYEDTPDQATATEQVKKDMEQTQPMDRLLCGDVGFGKTEVAIRAAFKAVVDGKQVAILVPTTILAYQHYRTFSERMESLPVSVEFINRFKSTKDQKETLKKLTEGKIDIIIGTHRLLGKDVRFKDLGLLIIDEEQKFGVSAKEKLRELRVNVDTLTLTATPIPRTLHFSLMGARDLSVINTPPLNRQPIQTELHVFNKDIIINAIDKEVSRGGQVFFVHNRVKDIETLREMIENEMPDIRIAIAHGQMDGNELEKTMIRFIEGDYDVLISTTIIETGLDIPNGNTIIINNAHMFGLSDLHQMRGRVGRSNTKAYCILLAPPLSSLTEEARKRLKTIEEFSDLGSGFQIAMRDMDIRGAGNLLGGEQSGFISEIGFDMYHKILDEAVGELKEEEFKDLFENQPENIKSRDCVVETDYEMLIPDHYISQISERLALYQELSAIDNDSDLALFTQNLEDRFGKIPQSTLDLIETIRLKWKGKELGFEKITLANNEMKIYLPANPQNTYFNSNAFQNLLAYITQHPTKFNLKQSIKSLILHVHNVSNLFYAIEVLKNLK
ncbi:MAG: transcription-repair coupling factor [Bacteroidia bacterium]|nr:transcription-repair coupling factor [Bacteroidia bacterium]MCO5254843.1 transcription-repair coupling factor [Bacteroidota bacterium]